MAKKRKILFITERRADYSRIKPIMKAVQESKKLQLQLVATGMHLLKYFGETKKVIRKDGFTVDATIPIFNEKDGNDGASMVKAMGRALVGMADVLKKLKPDIIFAGFDLGANFAAAIAGMHMNIHVSHIQGGEVSGTVDEVIRHAITKFSHIHFAATEKSKKRIIRLGEDPKYVFNVGSPSLDTILKTPQVSKKIIFKKYSLDPKKKTIILIQHPVTTEVNDVEKQISITIKAIKKVIKKHNMQALAIYSNNDAGGKKIVKRLCSSGIRVLPHIIFEDFLKILKNSDVLVGNSSSGIHEAPSFGLPTVNIGTRQQLRERGVNVIDTDHDVQNIIKCIEKSLFDKKFITKVKMGKNPYYNGNTSKKVVKILENLKFPSIQKVITY
ncbi:MAG: UDP-N-acetylglucosamine 2-epimerase [Parcubacteria group bacterium GW2011_GWA2_38_13]|nr:MAG: UDP-N-acetylglucosamine 2-epimerase [Parcubacteria group bacterium GW2011_GWA2_38_13]